MTMHRIGVDVGGTFTDVILADCARGRLWAVKVPTTPQDPSAGVVDGMVRVLGQSKTPGSEIGFVGHGTTIATNLLVEGKGARAALITTQGFRDAIEIRRSARHDRADLYDMFFDNPRPLVRRALRREVRERVLFDGRVDTPLDETGLRRELAQLRGQGVEAIAICFLHSYLNPAHEKRAQEIVRECFSEAFITTSFEVNPEIFEYERCSTTVINALLGPRCASYFGTLEDRVRASGVASDVYLMQSNGGLTKPQLAARRPVNLLASGPAGGVTAALNCSFPASVVGGNTATSQRVIDMLLAALAPAVPDRVIAQSHATAGSLWFGGLDPDAGRCAMLERKYVAGGDMNSGGMGARPDKDGINAIRVHIGNAGTQSVEYVEYSSPLTVERWSIMADSGGAGTWRGGATAERVYRVGYEEATCNVGSERGRYPPLGLFGGLPGALYDCTIERADGSVEHVPPKGRPRVVRRGDRVAIHSAGAGGYGDPLARDPARVLADVQDDYVSVAAAERDYGVVLEAGSDAVDTAATLKLRAARRGAR